MKRIILVCCLLQVSSVLLAQNNNDEDKSKKSGSRQDEIQTVFKKGRPLGFYFGWSTKPTALNNQLGIMTGGEFALSFGRKINMGIAGYGLISPVQSNILDQDGNVYYYDMAYGGFLFEPVLGSNRMLHLTFPVLVGAGGLAYHTAFDSWSNWEDHYDFQSGMFFIVEPGLHLEVNLLKWMRLHAGASYRFCGPGYFSVPQPGELNGWSGSIGLKLGLF